MKVALWVNRILLTLLSISTGAVKLVQMEEEMHIFREAGVGDGLTLAFGAIQLMLGLLLLPNQTTRPAAYGMAVTFVLATGVLFVNGLVAFGVFSLLFIASAWVHATRWE